jgi:uncharacterized protein
MTDSPPYGLTDAELEELNEFLSAHPGPHQFGLDAAHGLLTAVVVAPEPIAASEWLPLLVDEAESFVDADESNRVLTLIVRLYNSVVQELEAFTYQPIFAESDADEGGTRLTPKGWCEGFAAGIDLRSEIWGTRLATDPRLLEIMEPIIRLSAEEGVLDIDVVEEAPEADDDHLPGEDPLVEENAATDDESQSPDPEVPPESDHPMARMLEPMSEPDYDAALNAVAASVADVQQYWREYQPRHDEPFDESPKIVRRKRDGHWVH